MKGDSVTLTVVAESPDGGTLSYQWYSAADKTDAGTKIDGATSASYTIKNVEETKTYYVVVTNTKDGVSKSKISGKITITMTENIADVTGMEPVITENLAEMREVVSGDSCTLRISAESPDGGTLSYQWYSAESAAAEGTAIKGAEGASYTIEKVEKTLVYYVVVTNTNNGKSKSTASKKSTVKMTEKQDGMITVTLDVESIAYNTFCEGLKEVKFLDGSTKNKTISVQSGTTLADIIKEHDSIPLEVSEYRDEETSLDVTVNTHGTFYDELFNTAGEFYDFLSEEENKNAIETLVYTPLTSDCTFYAYPDVTGTDIEIYEREEQVEKLQWSQNSIPFYVGESKTAWVRVAADNWLCCYEAADGSGPATVTADSFVELKPTVCMKDEKKVFKVEAPAPGLYAFNVASEAMFTGILPNGNMKIKLEPAQFDEDLYFVGGATSWNFSYLEPFNEDDEFTFVAASAEGEFKVSTYEWGMRFTNNSDILSPGQSVPLTLCGVADEGKDENAKFSGLIAGATYTATLERDSSGMPTAISLKLVDVQFTEKLYFASDFSFWEFNEDTIQDPFKDNNEYAFVARKTEGSFKVTTSDWGLRFANDSKELTPGTSIPLTLCGEGKDKNGTISGLTQDELYRVILTRDAVTGIPISISLEEIPPTLYFVGTATSWDFTEATSFNSENKVTFTFSPKANETEIKFKISTDGWIKQFSVAGGTAEISSSEPTEVSLTRISGGAANGILSGLEAGKTYNVTVTLDNPTNPTKMTVECISQS